MELRTWHFAFCIEELRNYLHFGFKKKCIQNLVGKIQVYRLLGKYVRVYMYENTCIFIRITVKWVTVSEVSYGEVLVDKSTIYIRVTLYCGYLIVLWLFHLVWISYCGCLNLLCNVWASVYGGVLTIMCFGNMCICTFCVLYCL